MRYLTYIVLLANASVYAQTITRVEYYFDTDPGFGNGINITVTVAVDITRDFTVPLNTVSEGFHLLYVRAKGNNGVWSLPQSRPVLVQRSAQSASIYSIDRIEYFFDTDPGFGNGIAIPITSDTDLAKNFQLPLNTLAEGFHTIYYRTKSSNGLWSILLARPVFVQRNAQTTSTSTLKRIEYFMDSDPGFGNGTIVNASSSTLDQSLVINLSNVSSGFHIIYIRGEDIQGRWSQPLAKPFFAGKSGSNIVALEYYYDDGITKSPVRIYNSFTQGKDLTINFAAVLDGLLPNTSYQIHVTAINTDGQRSDESVHTFVTPAIICDPLSIPTTTGASRCGSGSVTLTASGAIGIQIYQWYTSATGGSSIASETANTFVTPQLTKTTTYFVAILNGTCESNRISVVATIINCNQPPVITAASTKIAAESIAIFDLNTLITDPDNNLDQTTIAVATPPASNALTSINKGLLTINYDGINFVGIETLTLEACDLQNSCTIQTLTIEVTGDLIIYNGVSPNGDGKNDGFIIRYIDLFPETQKNTVSIYNRWGSKVFEVDDYNNTTKVFKGVNDNGNELPSGTYFYKIEFTSGRPGKAGFLSLKR